jgi:hypothetical protein
MAAPSIRGWEDTAGHLHWPSDDAYSVLKNDDVADCFRGDHMFS